MTEGSKDQWVSVLKDTVDVSTFAVATSRYLQIDLVQKNKFSTWGRLPRSAESIDIWRSADCSRREHGPEEGFAEQEDNPRDYA